MICFAYVGNDLLQVGRFTSWTLSTYSVKPKKLVWACLQSGVRDRGGAVPNPTPSPGPLSAPTPTPTPGPIRNINK